MHMKRSVSVLLVGVGLFALATSASADGMGMGMGMGMGGGDTNPATVTFRDVAYGPSSDRLKGDRLNSDGSVEPYIDGVDEVRTGIGTSGFLFLKLAKGNQAAIRTLFFDFSDCASEGEDPLCDSPWLDDFGVTEGFSTGPLNVFTSGIDLNLMGEGNENARNDLNLLVELNLDRDGLGLWRLYFGPSNGECPGASDIDVKRVDDNIWEIEATQEDVACLEGNTGQGAHPTLRGLYHMPFKLTVTN